MLALSGMKDLKYPRLKLLDIIKKNTEKHVKDFRESEIDYRKALIKAAKKLAEAGDALNSAKDVPMEKLFLGFNNAKNELNSIRQPINQKTHYDRAYAMFELATDSEIELDQQVFSQLVLDEWDWKRDFAASMASNKSYLSS